MATMAPRLPTKAEENLTEEEQLLKLFRNRAELKKELDRLRNQSFQLTEQLKQQEARTLRIQQRLQQLETRLGDPELAETTVAYFHLRAAWEYCHGLLLAFGRELERLRFDKEQQQHIANFRRRVEASLVADRQEHAELARTDEGLAQQIRSLREQRSGKRGIWNVISRRRLTAEINAHRQERRAIVARLDTLGEDIETRADQEAPEFTGISLDAQRNINLTLIAYAQELFLHFADHGLAQKAREASIAQFMDVSYGDRRDCRELRRQVADRMQALVADNRIQARVKNRSRVLAGQVEYRRAEDKVPDAGTLSAIPILREDGRQKGELSLNVLSEEYWDIYDALLL